LTSGHFRFLVFGLFCSKFNFAEIFSPSPDTVEQILNDLTSSIVLQSAILDESLLLEIDMSDEFLQTWLSTLTFRFATLMYETIFIASFSGTIGKLMMGLRVVSANQIEWTDIRMTELKLTGCRYATWKNAFVRSFMKNISSLLMIPGHMTPLFNKMRRAIYDSVAGTIVVTRVKIQN